MFKKFATIITAGIIIGSLCGCSNIICRHPAPELVPTDTVIVAGNHDNTKSFNTSETEETIKESCLTGGTITIIIADGAPYVAAEIQCPAIDKSYSQSKLESIVNQNTAQVMSLLSSDEAKAKTPEFSDLRAIELAARQFRSSDKENKRLIVMDTGVDTTGPLTFVNSLIDTIDTQKVVANLEASMDIPDLSGIQIVFSGLGDVGGAQKELTPKERAILKDLWSLILSKSNAVSVEFSEATPIGGQPGFTELPEVSCVEVIQSAGAIETYDPKTSIRLGEEILNFKPGSAELLTDVNEVKKILKPIADYMTADNNGEQLLLIGTTASAGTTNELKELSLKRCATVKDILVSMGVNDGQLKTLGTGIDNPFYQNDILSDGSLDSEIAKTNRSVIICGYDSQTAQSVLNY